MKLFCKTLFLAVTAALVSLPPVTAACDAGGWCVEFTAAEATLDGGTDADILLTYDAAEPSDSSDDKYYKVRIMEEANGVCAKYKDDGGVTPFGLVNGRVPYANWVDSTGALSVGLDVDTANIASSSFTTTTTGDNHSVKFCVEVTLYTTLTGQGETEVASEKTIMDFSIDLTQGFTLTGFSATSEVASNAGTTTVEVDYDLSACVCDNADTCLADGSGFLPGSAFDFCIFSNDGEAQVIGLTDVNFVNTAGSLTIPIINDNGNAVGLASFPACANGVCRVAAVTYAKLYESVALDGVVSDISGSNAITGTSILEFASGGSSITSPSEGWTGAEATEACLSSGLDCCVGAGACSWTQSVPLNIAEGACVGDLACEITVNSASTGFSVTIGKDSCVGQWACSFRNSDGGSTKKVQVGQNSCRGPETRDRICLHEPRGISDAEFIVGDNSCSGVTDTTSIYVKYTQRQCGGRRVYVGNGSCRSGDGAGSQVQNCMSTSFDQHSAGEEPDVVVGDGSCIGRNSPCKWVSGTIGDGSCLGDGACYGHVGDIGDGQIAASRRLASPFGGETNVAANKNSSRKLVFTSSFTRELQDGAANGETGFDLEVNLAGPPDRSSAIAGSSALAFVSLMVGGFLGLMGL